MTTPRRLRVPVAVHILVRRGDDILVLRRAHTGYEDGSYSVPAGHLERGESVLAAAAREAREECAIEILEPEVVGVMHRLAPDGARVDFFVAPRRYRGEPRNAEPDRCDDLRFVPRRRLPQNLIPYVRAAVEHDGGACGPWFLSFGWPQGAAP